MDPDLIEDNVSPKKPKRVRLSLACNQCRKRKVKCDAEMPQCKNCRIRGLECLTTDPRNPELVVYRKPPINAPQASIAPSPAHTQSTSTTSPSGDASRLSLSGHRHSTNASYEDHGSRLGQQSAPPAEMLSQPLEKSNSLNGGRHGPIAINRIGTRHQRKLMGSSSMQSLVMVLDLCFEKLGRPGIAPAFRHGMVHAEEFAIPFQVQMPELPEGAVVDSLLDKFDKRIRPIVPFIETWHIKAKIQYFTEVQDHNAQSPATPLRLQDWLRPLDVPFLACAYAVLSLGADEAAGGTSDLGSHFLTAAYSLNAHLVAMPYVASVQALLLMAIALRARSKDGQAALLLGQAIRIAQSIGMHRSTSKSGTYTPEEPGQTLIGDDLHARIWWICFGLEKIFELETTRPTAAHRADCDQLLPTLSTSSFPYYVHFVSLSLVLGQISDTLFRAKRERGSAAIFLRNVLDLDEALSQWYLSVPEHIHPGHLYCDDSELPFAMFLSQQYHQALITLHRAALSIPQQEYTSEVEKLQLQSSGGTAAWQRLKKGADLCLQSAKAIVRVDAEAADSKLSSTLFTISPSLLASVVLALQIIRQPMSRMVSSDLEMLLNETLHVEERYRAAGQSEDFIKICEILRTSMMDFVTQARATQQDADAQSANASRQMLTPSSCLSATHTRDLAWPSDQPMAQDGDLGLFDPFQNVAFEDFWIAFDPFPAGQTLVTDNFGA